MACRLDRWERRSRVDRRPLDGGLRSSLMSKNGAAGAGMLLSPPTPTSKRRINGSPADWLLDGVIANVFASLHAGDAKGWSQ